MNIIQKAQNTVEKYAPVLRELDQAKERLDCVTHSRKFWVRFETSQYVESIPIGYNSPLRKVIESTLRAKFTEKLLAAQRKVDKLQTK